MVIVRHSFVKSSTQVRHLILRPLGQCIHNEIHRPYKVRCIRAQKRKPFGRQPFTASSAFYAQSIKVVKSLDLRPTQATFGINKNATGSLKVLRVE